MSLTDFKGMLDPKIVFNVDTSSADEATFVLRETNTAAKIKPIKLVIPTHDCIVFTLNVPNDRTFDRKSNYLKKGHTGIHQGCDYVVACVYKNRLNYILIELKSDSVAGAKKQLWNSTPFIEYLDSLISTHFPHCFSSLDRDKKYLLFSTAKAHQLKTTTSYKTPCETDNRGFSVYIGGAVSEFRLGSIIRS